MAKHNVARDDTLGWDRYATQPPEHALPLIYQDALDRSKELRSWYWISIQDKKRGSYTARISAYVLLLVGIGGPLSAALATNAEYKLELTQAGVIALAIAGIVQLADKIFGWSSGWLRYITTVTAMERLTLQFELDWANCLLSRTAPAGAADVKQHFELAKHLQLELEKQRGEETSTWLAEFTAGMAALNEMIKLQQETADKARQAMQTAMDARTSGSKAGSIQLTIAEATRRGKPFAIYLDDDLKQTLSGNSWSMAGLQPGHYRIRVVVQDGSPIASEGSTIAVVAPGEVTNVKIDLN